MSQQPVSAGEGDHQHEPLFRDYITPSYTVSDNQPLENSAAGSLDPKISNERRAQLLRDAGYAVTRTVPTFPNTGEHSHSKMIATWFQKLFVPCLRLCLNGSKMYSLFKATAFIVRLVGNLNRDCSFAYSIPLFEFDQPIRDHVNCSMENNSVTTGHPIPGVEDQTLAGISTAHPAENPPLDESLHPEPFSSALLALRQGASRLTPAGTQRDHSPPPTIDEPDPLWSILYDRILESYDKELIKRLHRSIRLQLCFANVLFSTSFSFFTKIEKWIEPDYTQRLERLQMLQDIHRNDDRTFTMESLEAQLALAPAGPPTPSTLLPCALSLSSSFIGIVATFGALIAMYMLSQYEGIRPMVALNKQDRLRHAQFKWWKKWYLQRFMKLVWVLLANSFLLFIAGTIVFYRETDKKLARSVLAHTAVAVATSPSTVLFYFIVFFLVKTPV